MKLSAYRIGIKLDKDNLGVEQNNYLTTIVNVYIVYDLDDWLKIRHITFTLKKLVWSD